MRGLAYLQAETGVSSVQMGSASFCTDWAELDPEMELLPFWTLLQDINPIDIADSGQMKLQSEPFGVIIQILQLKRPRN